LFLKRWKKKRKEKTTPISVNLMISQILYRAAQMKESYTGQAIGASKMLGTRIRELHVG